MLRIFKSISVTKQPTGPKSYTKYENEPPVTRKSKQVFTNPRQFESRLKSILIWGVDYVVFTKSPYQSLPLITIYICTYGAWDSVMVKALRC
jgi:hypothetical protein